MLCPLFPFCRFLLFGSPLSYQACVFWAVSNVAEFTDAASPGPCSIANWIPRSAFFFLLGISTSNYFFLLNSSKFSRVSWFHSQTFCFQGAEPWPEVKPDQVSSPTPPYTVWMSPHCHHSQHLLQCKPFRTHKWWRKSKNRDPRSSRGWETWGHMM